MFSLRTLPLHLHTHHVPLHSLISHYTFHHTDLPGSYTFKCQNLSWCPLNTPVPCPTTHSLAGAHLPAPLTGHPRSLWVGTLHLTYQSQQLLPLPQHILTLLAQMRSELYEELFSLLSMNVLNKSLCLHKSCRDVENALKTEKLEVARNGGRRACSKSCAKSPTPHLPSPGEGGGKGRGFLLKSFCGDHVSFSGNSVPSVRALWIAPAISNAGILSHLTHFRRDHTG